MKNQYKDLEKRKLYQRNYYLNKHKSDGYSKLLLDSDKLSPFDRGRAKRYKLTKEEYTELINSKGGLCGICGVDKPGGRGDWHVDHDHITDKVRGLLCARCNAGLGMFKEDKEILYSAIQYLLDSELG